MPTVTIVDRDQQRSELFADLFESLGFRAASTSSIHEAFRKLDEWRPSLIVLDLSIDDQEGIDAMCLMAPELPPIIFHASSPCWPFYLPITAQGRVFESSDLAGMLQTLVANQEAARNGASLVFELADMAR